jgi:FixJ family two-component response regulator
MNPDDSVVFIVDDDVSVREALRNLLRSVGLTVQSFATAQEFLTARRPDVPGCLILDVRLPDLSGLDLQRQLIEAEFGMPIIFITGYGDIPMSVRAMKAGAVEFLTKPFRDQDILDAVQQSIGRDREARRNRAEIIELRRRYADLTTREQEVMKFVVQGMVNKQIAAELGIAEPTVKLHRGRLMHKMCAGSLAELIKLSEKLAASTKPLI